MAIKFIEHEDLPLKNSPLTEVICQVRFVPLLEIVEKLPTKFQSKIRTRFPNFSIKQINLESDKQPLPSEYEFLSIDKLSSASLGLNFIALSKKYYSGWTNYLTEFEFILDAFSSSYEEILATRIGLRYINEITLKGTGMSSTEELLKILNNDLMYLIINESWDLPRKVIHQLSIPDDENEFTLRVAFERDTNPRIIMDFDYFSFREIPVVTTTEEIREVLQKFHRKNYSAFRWSINEEYLKIFNPQS